MKADSRKLSSIALPEDEKFCTLIRLANDAGISLIDLIQNLISDFADPYNNTTLRDYYQIRYKKSEKESFISYIVEHDSEFLCNIIDEFRCLSTFEYTRHLSELYEAYTQSVTESQGIKDAFQSIEDFVKELKDCLKRKPCL